MLSYNARDLAFLTEEELWQMPDAPIKLVFDDGVIETHMRQTIFSWFMWKVIREFPRTPLFKHHHIQNARLTSRTHLDLLGKVLWDCYDTYAVDIDKGVADLRQRKASMEEIFDLNQKRRIAFIEDLCLLTYQATDDVYNSLSYKLERYVTTLSILDFIEVIDNPEIKALNAALEPTQDSISDTHKKIKAVIMNPGTMVGNPIAEAMKSGLVSPGQVMQCVSAVGFRTDIDSNIFKNPILSSFTEGLVSLHDHAIESRSASKSLMLTKDPLRTAEYFNRKLQLATATLQRINIGDCGSTKLMPFRVLQKDLVSIAGKYYQTDAGLVAIKESDKHLVGKLIHYRSALFCLDSDPSGVCSTCFGQLALNIPADTNLGHVAGTEFCRKTTQNIMSTKHLDGSAEVDDIMLSADDQRYIRIGNKDNTILLNPRLAGMKLSLILVASESDGLVDLRYTDNIRALAIHNLTALNDVELVVNTGKIIEKVKVPVSRDNRRSALTYEALIYVKEKGWSLTKEGNYLIDLTDWDVNVPLFKLPLKHVSTIDYVNSVEAKMIGLGKKDQNNLDMRPLSAYSNPEEALMSLYELVDTRLKVNIAHLEAIVLSTTIRSKDKPDHSIMEKGGEFRSGKYRDNLARRSLSALLAYQGQRAVLYDPSSFNIQQRPPHVLDDFISP